MARILNAVLDSEEYKCSCCNNYLSVSPILKVEGQGTFCGRCEDTFYHQDSNPNIQRQVAYENLAKNCQFPCAYKDYGCEEILKWEHVQHHEKNCGFGIMECLLNWEEFGDEVGCEWTGDRRDCFQHLLTYHKLSYRSYLLDIDRYRNCLFKVNYRNNYFVLVILYEDNIHHLMLIGDETKQVLEYQIKISDDTGKQTYVYTDSSKYLPYNVTQMRKNSKKLKFQDIIMKYITLFCADMNECSVSQCTNYRLFPFCAICKEPITFPAFRCTSRPHHHTICEECSRKDRCSAENKFLPGIVCNANFERDRQVESPNAHLKCFGAGCFFHGNIFDVLFHSQSCTYVTKSQSNYSELNHYYKLENQDRKFFIFDDKLFGIDIKCTNGNFKFCGDLYKFTDIKYKFELTIQNSSSTVRVFTFTPFCVDPVAFYVLDKVYEKVEVKRTLLNKDGTGNLTYKLNISKKL